MKIKQDEKKPIPQEIIADAIIKISKSMQYINETGLSRAAIIALIHDRSKVKKGDIEIVLNNLEQMEFNWLRKI